MSDNIPFEIQSEIIKRLPIKPLIQFRLVSKEWKSFIDSPYFITNYHTDQPKPQHRLLVSYADNNNSEEKYVSIPDDESFPQRMFSLTVPESVKLLTDSTMVTSQGLLCSYVYNKAVIWNPAIRKSVSIDVPNDIGSAYETVVGFGVCPSTSDPKLVNVAFNHTSGSRTMAEVFSLGVGAWRRLAVNFPCKPIAFTKNSVAIDRFIYWHAYRPRDGPYSAHWFDLIVSFDMVSEEFKEICLPDSLALDFESGLFISKMGESLVVFQNNIEAREEICSVWEMEDGVPKVFKKLFTIKAPEGFINVIVIGFRNNREALVEMVNELEVAALFGYNANSESSSHIGITGKPFKFSVSSYIETLLLLDH